MEKFRTLRADEIECRIATIKSNGLSLLLYKDARCDMNILDEVIGAENWERSHSRDNANCKVSIWDNDKEQWISKEDTGTESFTEKEKGLASDSFKRACFNWGIGRELYTAPFIWINTPDCTIKKSIVSGKEKCTCYDRFYVSNIGYNKNKVIEKLQIKHSKTHKVVFELGKIESQSEEVQEKLATDAQKKTIRSICSKHGIDADERYLSMGKSEEVLTETEAAQILTKLKASYGDD